MNMFTLLHRHHSRKGFTLIEMVISLAIFSIVAVIAVGALVRILGQNRQAQSIQSSVNNLSFALESMSRELRTGRNYHCYTLPISSSDTYLNSAINGVSLTPAQCSVSSGGGVAIAFNSSIIMPTGLSSPSPATCNLVYAYRFVPSGSNISIEKAEQTACGTPVSTGDFYPIVASSTVITGYRLAVNKPSGTKYALAFIRLAGYSGQRVQDQKYFDVETMISERITDQ